MSEAVAELGETGEGVESLPADSAVEQNAEQQQGSGDDFWNRVATDGEFAREQIVKRDQKASELSNRVKALEPVEQLVNMANGVEPLMELATLGSRVQQVPGLMDVVRGALETGRVELPQATSNAAEEEETWIDPDVREAITPLKQEIASLKEQLGSLAQLAGAADVRSKEQRVRENVTAALEEFSGDPEAYQEASERVMNQYRAALRAAEGGDSVQAKLIDDLAGPNGKSILETVTMPIYKKYAAKLVSTSNASTPKAAEEVRRGTDERSSGPARPGASHLPPRPKGRVSDDYVLKVMQAAAAEKGIDLSRL